MSGPAGVYTGLLSMHNLNVYADTVFLREYLISLNTLQPWTILSMVAHSESVSVSIGIRSYISSSAAHKSIPRKCPFYFPE